METWCEQPCTQIFEHLVSAGLGAEFERLGEWGPLEHRFEWAEQTTTKVAWIVEPADSVYAV